MKPLRDTPFSAEAPVRVSICSITFNHAPFLRDCLEGFLDPLCDVRGEVVIHDDAAILPTETTVTAERRGRTLRCEPACALAHFTSGACASDMPRRLAWSGRARPHSAFTGRPLSEC